MGDLIAITKQLLCMKQRLQHKNNAVSIFYLNNLYNNVVIGLQDKNDLCIHGGIIK